MTTWNLLGLRGGKDRLGKGIVVITFYWVYKGRCRKGWCETAQRGGVEEPGGPKKKGMEGGWVMKKGVGHPLLLNPSFAQLEEKGEGQGGTRESVTRRKIRE